MLWRHNRRMPIKLNSCLFNGPFILPMVSWAHLWTQVLLAHLGLAWRLLCRRCKPLTDMNT